MATAWLFFSKLFLINCGLEQVTKCLPTVVFIGSERPFRGGLLRKLNDIAIAIDKPEREVFEIGDLVY